MAKTTIVFDCDAPQSLADADVYVEGENKPFRRMKFVDGKNSFKFDEGRYELSIRVIGTPRTRFALKLTGGGKMVPIDTILPTAAEVGKEDAGRDAFERILTVKVDQ
jgi:hypothetical protein